MISPSEEYRRFRDSETGAVIHQLTGHASINHPTYFLNRSFTPDGCVVFTSYRTGQPHLYERRFPDGPIRLLTSGGPIHALSATVSLNEDEVFFVRGGSILAVERHTRQERLVAEFPRAQLGECSLSRDGRWLAAALKDAGGHGVAVAAADGGESGVAVRFPRTVIHPQFHPADSGWIEFAGDPAPRMHRARRDGSGLECLYQHANEEFVVHETFLGASEELAFVVWPFALKRMNWHTRQIATIAAFNAWHITPNRDGSRIVCDTAHPDAGIQLVETVDGSRRTVCFPRSSNGGSQWKTSRYALAGDWAAAAQAREKDAALSWMEMAADTVYGPQWTHPHPSFNLEETMVIYASDVSGFPQVYVVEL